MLYKLFQNIDKGGEVPFKEPSVTLMLGLPCRVVQVFTAQEQ